MDNSNIKEYKVILGNGFDINLGLETSYKDFLKSNEFKKISDNNFLANYFRKKSNLLNWVNVEEELKFFVKHYKNYQQIKLKNEYDEIKSALIKYLQIAQERNLGNAMQTHSGHLMYLINKVLDAGAKVDILNFNYTNSFFKVSNEQLQNNHIFVHGSLENKDIIFGIDDKDTGDMLFNFVKKSFADNFNRKIVKNFKSESLTKIIFFGHSLGSTDHDYFRILVDNEKYQKNTELMIFHYGNDGKQEIKNQFNNMSQDGSYGTFLGGLKEEIKWIDVKKPLGEEMLWTSLITESKFG